MKKNWLIAAVLLATASAFAASDPNDIDDSADHPEVPRFPGFHIDGYKHNDFNEFTFATKGFDDEGNPKGEKHSGKFWEITYVLNDEARAPGLPELINNYDNAFKKVGGKLVRKDTREGNPQFAVFQVPRGKGGASRWVEVQYSAQGGRYVLDIVDEGDMEQKLEVSASEMADAIKKNGFIALHGILFDTGKATIKPESEPLLAEIVSLMNSDKSLKLAVEGHTDNVGNKKSNLELSKKRAESVMQFLVGKGIDGKRLKADGKGDTVPVADNRTEDGRAQNRRVELVKF